MPTVTEPAVNCKFLNIGESAADSIGRIPKLQLSHPRRVDYHTATRNQQQLAGSRSVAAPIVVLADSPRSKLFAPRQRVAEQSIDERGFPDSGRTEQSCGNAALLGAA